MVTHLSRVLLIKDLSLGWRRCYHGTPRIGTVLSSKAGKVMEQIVRLLLKPEVCSRHPAQLLRHGCLLAEAGGWVEGDMSGTPHRDTHEI